MEFIHMNRQGSSNCLCDLRNKIKLCFLGWGRDGHFSPGEADSHVCFVVARTLTELKTTTEC